METLTYTLLALNIADLVLFPGYMVWIIRHGNHDYDFQQFHRLFNLIQLFLFILFIRDIPAMTNVQLVVAATFIASMIFHNYKDSYKYLLRLRKNAEVLNLIRYDLIHYHALVMEGDYDVANAAWGKRWGVLDYFTRFGARFACDILAIAAFFVFFV